MVNPAFVDINIQALHAGMAFIDEAAQPSL
jgi:hypothetical protein